MIATGENIPGVTVDVADLVNVRSRLSNLNLNRVRLTASQAAGVRRTRIRGRGLEYEESRGYMIGDDVRTMDWRLMARTGEAHTKVFAEEKQRSIFLAVDLSASMFFGTRYALKSWTAAQLAAHMGWLAINSGDRVGGLIVSSTSHQEVRPVKSQAGLMRVFHYLSEETRIDLPMDPSTARLNFALQLLRGSVKSGSTVVLISDFLNTDSHTQELISSLARHNEVLMFWVHDKTETESWLNGHYQIIVGKQNISFDITPALKLTWLEKRQRNLRRGVQELVSGPRTMLCPISCNQSVTSQIGGYLRKQHDRT